MDGAGGAEAPQGLIGPNAVVQLGHAVAGHLGPDAAMRLFRAAGLAELLVEPPRAMIDEALPARLFETLWQLHPDTAHAHAAEAGRRTADYVIAHRIPQLAQKVLRLSPRSLGARLLLQAIRKNAWTFAGSGRCAVTGRPPFVITIEDNPLVMPECAWHAAVFKRLFDRLIQPGTSVELLSCSNQGAPSCQFGISLPHQ